MEGSLLPKLASGFGGGIGRKGSLCGAFIGGIMVIGMKMGREDPKDRESLLKIYGKCQSFWNKFEKEFGSHLCYHLIGAHLEDEEERQCWLASGGMEKCERIVERTAQILLPLLMEE